MQVNMGVLIHQESIVKVIRLETRHEPRFEFFDNGPQIMHFFIGQIADVFVMSPQTNHALAQLVLIMVRHHPPVVSGIHHIGF